MASLKADFDELMRRVQAGRDFAHASFEPIFYLVFRPSEILEVKRLMPAWTARLRNEGWQVEVFSIANEVNKILAAAPTRKIWLEADRKSPLDWEKTNKALANALSSRGGQLQAGLEALLASLEGRTRAIVLVTDLEALHPYLRKRVRLGRAVEGRDEKGIKKTLCAFLEILHPTDPPTDEEFDEYAAYAVECRRRIKEQMNKRKPDDEFAKIDLSFTDRTGKEMIVLCPESSSASATLEPLRRRLKKTDEDSDSARPEPAPTVPTSVVPPIDQSGEGVPAATPLTERHFTIQYDDVGHSYDLIFGPYLVGARAVTIEEPYVRAPHQITNFVRFCETVVKAAPTARRIHLVSSYDDKTDLASVRDKLEELKQSLMEADVFLEIELKANLHDREVRIDNGWTVKIGRGLDFFQKPESWFSIGANDMALRRCLETKVDIFRSE